MPRKSLRRKAIDIMEAKVRKLRLLYYLREADDEEDSLEDDRLIIESKKLDKMKATRYLFRHSSYRKDKKKFDLVDALSKESKNYNDEEFLQAFRVSRDSFFYYLMKCKIRLRFNQLVNLLLNSVLFPSNYLYFFTE